MKRYRVAFFADSFHEVNGVALTSREFVAFARRNSLPFLAAHAGPENRVFQDGALTTVEFQRSRVRWQLERDLAIDFLFLRHREWLAVELASFRPDLIHITGPSDAGILGALLAHQLKVPLCASWHTNLHEFGAHRLVQHLRWLPGSFQSAAARWAEHRALDQCVRFYKLAQVLFAPNPELVEMLENRTGRPTFLMPRGIDMDLFSPARRVRTDDQFVLGYVGRLSPEKNVRMLAGIEEQLVRAGLGQVRFLIVGEGSEKAWLRSVMRRGELPGILRGEELARAYASMDAFIFPSSTDTFGNVVLEAMASGVPAIVTRAGGPKFLVAEGLNGYIADGPEEFAARALELSRNPELLALMRSEARRSVQKFSWDAVFSGVFDGYGSMQPRANPADAAASRPKTGIDGDDPRNGTAMSLNSTGSLSRMGGVRSSVAKSAGN